LPDTCRLPDRYALEITSDHDACVHCGERLRRVRTSTHYPIGIMLGTPKLRLIHRQCIRCGQPDSHEVYHQHVPRRGNYAFDLIVQVGLARLQDHRQDVEVQKLLQQKWGLSLPLSSIGLLVHSFLDGLAALHQAHIPALRQYLEKDGGYALHVDGTCEPQTDVLFMAIAQPRGWTLETAKMPTENAESIRVMMCRCVDRFGKPLAVVRDLSQNIEKATRQAIPDVPDLICQYHFLENVGEKLCQQPHGKLTSALRRIKIRPALKSLRSEILRWSQKTTRMSRSQVESLLSNPENIADLDPVGVRRFVSYVLLRWLDDYTADLKGEYFPFDLPSLAFYRRGVKLYELLGGLFESLDLPAAEMVTLGTMARHLAQLRDDTELVESAERLEKAAALFEELRAVLRLSSHPQEKLLRGQGVPKRTESVKTTEHRQKSLAIWREGLRRQNQHEPDEHKRADRETVLRYLDKYSDQLSGHVIQRKGRPPFLVARTNNVAEHRFSATKRGVRRRVGAKKLTRQVHAMRPESLLVNNLADPQYVQLVCGENLGDLATAIARHWPLALEIRQQRMTATSTHPIPTTKKQLRNPTLIDRVETMANKLLESLQKKRHAA
jgi:hypothetical protein